MADEELCAKCGRANIAGCDGSGYTRVDDTTVQKCVNIHRRELAQHLGPEIANCTHTTNTPLLKLNPAGGEPLVDLTQRNLFIKCRWRGLLPHLKYVLGIKATITPTLHHFRIVTDERIRNVFLGDESYKSRSTKVRDDLSTYNKLADFLGADFDLVIVKLGYLGYKNAAAPGALKEALLHRESINLPTWLVLDPNNPWTHSYDPDVGGYVDAHFQLLELVEALGAPSTLEEPIGMSESEEVPKSLDDFVVEGEGAATDPAPAPDPDPAPDPPAPAYEPPTELKLPGDDQPQRFKKKWRGS